MIVPNARFRPNPDRAIYVQGLINQEMVDRLTPEIVSLTHKARDPITIYIDSDGGIVLNMETILRLLNASDQDGASPCWNVTVVMGRAASAAADLLSSGDYAVAYPGTTILYHGVRISQNIPLTTERTSLLVQYLRESNSTYAASLARKVVDRFMFRFVSSQDEFEGIRKDKDDPELSDLDCFLSLISENLSESAQQVLMSAQTRYGRYDELLRSLMKTRLRPGISRAQAEAVQIKAIVDFELRKNKKKKDWSFEKGGLDNLADDFFLLNEFLGNYRSGFFATMCARYGQFLLSDEENEEILKAPKEERAKLKVGKSRPYVLPVWSFFVALCHALQYGENQLTAIDAVWLGMIDEVLGVDLPSRRLTKEYEPDVEDEENENKPEQEETRATAAGADATRPEARPSED